MILRLVCKSFVSGSVAGLQDGDSRVSSAGFNGKIFRNPRSVLCKVAKILYKLS